MKRSGVVRFIGGLCSPPIFLFGMWLGATIDRQLGFPFRDAPSAEQSQVTPYSWVERTEHEGWQMDISRPVWIFTDYRILMQDANQDCTIDNIDATLHAYDSLGVQLDDLPGLFVEALPNYLYQTCPLDVQQRWPR